MCKLTYKICDIGSIAGTNADSKKILTSNSQKVKQIVASPKCLPLE